MGGKSRRRTCRLRTGQRLVKGWHGARLSRSGESLAATQIHGRWRWPPWPPPPNLEHTTIAKWRCAAAHAAGAERRDWERLVRHISRSHLRPVSLTLGLVRRRPGCRPESLCGATMLPIQPPRASLSPSPLFPREGQDVGIHTAPGRPAQPCGPGGRHFATPGVRWHRAAPRPAGIAPRLKQPA